MTDASKSAMPSSIFTCRAFPAVISTREDKVLTQSNDNRRRQTGSLSDTQSPSRSVPVHDGHFEVHEDTVVWLPIRCHCCLHFAHRLEAVDRGWWSAHHSHLILTVDNHADMLQLSQ